MDHVRAYLPEHPVQTKREGKIRIAAAGHVDDVHVVGPCDFVDLGIRGADEYGFDVAGLKAAHQPDDLLRAAIKIAAGFDVNNFQAGCPGIDFAYGRG